MGFFGVRNKKQPDAEPDSTVYVNMDKHCSELPIAVPVDSTFAAYEDSIRDSSSRKENITPTWMPSPQPLKHSQRALGSTVVFKERRPIILASCPYCGGIDVATRTVARPDIWTWGAVVLLLIVFWPICVIPLLLNICKNVVHFCTACEAQVGHAPSFQDFCVREERVSNSL